MGYLTKLIERNFDESYKSYFKSNLGKYSIIVNLRIFKFYKNNVLISIVEVKKTTLDIWEKRKGYKNIITGSESNQISQRLHNLTNVIGQTNWSDR